MAMKHGIEERNGRYYPVISYKDSGTGRSKRKWLSGFTRRRDAQKARAEAIAQLGQGMPIQSGRETVASLFSSYFRTAGANRVRPVTLESYESMMGNHLIPLLGAKPASALTADDLNLMMSNIVKAGRSATTARYALRIVHRVLDDAVRKRKLLWNVADFADPPRAKRYEPQIWDESELDRFLTVAASPAYADFYEYFATNALTGGAPRRDAWP